MENKTTLTDQDKKVFAKAGHIGGTKTAKRGKKYMAKIGKKGAAKRWSTTKTKK